MSIYWLQPWYCLFTSTRLIQCSGSGSVIYLHRSGSWSGTGSLHQQEKIWRKTSLLVFCDFLWLFICEKWCKCSLQKWLSIKNSFFWHREGHWWKEQVPEPDPDPDPFVKGTDPRIRIRVRTKMSRIRNTGVSTPSAGSKGVKRLIEPLRKQNQLWPWPTVPSINHG